MSDGGNNPYDASANAFSQAGSMFGDVGTAGQIGRAGSQYMNPYQEGVIDNVTGRMTDQRNMALGQVGDNAIQSGAFGGGRHGIVEGEIYDNSQRNIGEMQQGMYQQGFDTSMGLGAQDVGYQMGAGQNMQNLGSTMFGVGNTLGDRQMRDGLMQRGISQEVLGGAANGLDQYMNSPNDALNSLLAAVRGDPRSQESTQSYNPGLYDYLGLGMQTAGDIIPFK